MNYKWWLDWVILIEQVLRRDLVRTIEDNAPAHRADSTVLELDLLGLDRVVHAPYSPDLAPMDFKVFPTVKAELRGKTQDETPPFREN